MKLENKVALVTGGARGIGKEIALTFAREGANVIICDVDKEVLESAKKEIESVSGKSCMAEKVDVTSLEDCQNLVDNILDNHANIDILVNNAGITRDNLVLRMSENEWDSVIDVNLKGAFNCMKAVTRKMMKQRYGKIVNMASIIGIMGNAGQANYSASKGGLISLTKTLAKELGSRNINVNAIAPGFIQTDMTDKLGDDAKEKLLKFVPLGTMGSVKDVANLALFLASDDSSYITGQAIKVDGGMVM